MLRLLWISTSMFLSVLMGAAIFAGLWIYYPDAYLYLVGWGKALEDNIFRFEAISAQMRAVADFLLSGQQLVFLFLVILSRILLALVGALFSRRDRYY